VKELVKYENRKIPSEVNYSQIGNLSEEAREKLTKRRPASLGAAMRMIAGINPTDIQVLNYYLNKNYPQRN
jgi:tRNA uridine 5-carboxymethylaminomethyl modification enzyme